MAADYVRFTVKVLPLARKRSDGREESEELARTLAIGAKRAETFGGLLQKVQARYNARYHTDSEREAQVGQLQDSNGADIFDEDTIGSLYDSTSMGKQHTIYARLETIDGSHLAEAAITAEGRNPKRRASDEGMPDEQGSAKRRKVRPECNQLLEGSASEGMDEDGFRIPKRKQHDNGRGVGGGNGTQSAVLVEDSQPPFARSIAHGSAFAKLQHRRGVQTSSPTTGSSPLVATASRGAANGHVNLKYGKSGGALPTPESRGNQRAGADPDASGQTSNSKRVSSWFKRTPVAARSAAGASFTQDDPIEDGERQVESRHSTARIPSSSHPEHAAISDAKPRVQGNELVGAAAGGYRARLKPMANDTLRTPSLQRSKSALAETSHAPSSSGTGERVRNTARSVAHGWTKEEDDNLLEGLSARKGMTVGDVLKEYSINRSASAARSRYHLLLRHQGDRQANTLNFPSSSLAKPQSESDDERSISQQRSKPKRWSQNDIGTLRKAVAEGLDAHEIQVKYFSDRSEEAIMKKMRQVLPSVSKVERRRDSFPNNAVLSHLWTDQHDLKLRRAYREGLNVVAAASKFFKSMPKMLVEEKMKAYRQQMEDLAVERSTQQHRSSNMASSENSAEGSDHDIAQTVETRQDSIAPEQDTTAGEEASQMQDDVDAEILRELEALEPTDDDGPTVQDSYETGSAMDIASSPPLLRKPLPRMSPQVVIPPTEQRDAREAQRRSSQNQPAHQPQLRRSTSSGGQTQLNFQRDKGKGAVRPAVNIHELDRMYNRRPAGNSAPPVGKSPQHEVVDVSSDDENDDRDASGEDAEVETSQPLPQLDRVSSSTVKNQHRRQLSDGATSDGNATVSSAEPSRQLALELEQSMSAAEQSSQSQTAPAQFADASSQTSPPKSRPVAYVHIPGPLRQLAISSVQEAQSQSSEDEKDEFETQGPSITLSQRQKENTASQQDASQVANGDKPARASTSDEESLAFQTQDPGTTLSQKQKQKQKPEPSGKASSTSRDAADRSNVSQHFERNLSPASEVQVPFSANQEATRGVKLRRRVYDIPGSSQPAEGFRSQRSSLSLPQSSSEKRRPGQLPQILGPASRLRQRKKDAEAKIAARRVEREARLSSQSLSAVASSRQKDDVDEVSRQDTQTSRSLSNNNNNNNNPLNEAAKEHDMHDDLTRIETSTPIPELPTQHATLSPTAAFGHDSYGTTSESQVQVEATVELPYPQILSREPGPNGDVEVGRPSFSWMFPRDCVYLRTNEDILAAATREAKGERDIRRRAEDMKLSDQQAIAMCCNDSDKLKELHKVERRRRRERRVEDGLPPSRGPAERYWAPGIPKPIAWDVNIMPDSDDSMSSRGRDIDEEEEASKMEEPSDVMDDDDNPAYFDKERHFSEVEDESDAEEQVGGAQRSIAGAVAEDREQSSADVDSEPDDEDPLKDLLDIEAEESDGDGDKDDGSRSKDDGSEHYTTVRDKSEEGAMNGGAGDVALNDVSAVSAEMEGIAQVAGTEPDDADRVSGVGEDTGIPVGPHDSRASDDEEKDEDADLPTAPPPISDDVDAISTPALSDRHLQELAQSGDVDSEADREERAIASPATRSLPGLGSAPALPPAEGAFDNPSPSMTDSFNPVNSSQPDDPAEFYRRRNASLSRNPELTDSMIPPWPSSGKVRSSLEESATQTPPAASNEASTMATKTSVKQSHDSGNAKKRKLRVSDEEMAEHAASRKARKKERKAEKKTKAQLESKPPASDSHRSAAGMSSTTKAVIESVTAKAGAADSTSASAVQSSKKHKKRRKKARQASDKATGLATDRPQSTPVRPDDRLAMPPPSLPPQHAKVMQQSSLPSPDSEISHKLHKASKKRAAKRAKRDARRSSMSISVNDSMTSDTSLQLPVASSPPVISAARVGATAPQILTQPTPKHSSPKQATPLVDTASIQNKAKKHSHKKKSKPAEGSREPLAQPQSKPESEETHTSIVVSQPVRKEQKHLVSSREKKSQPSKKSAELDQASSTPAAKKSATTTEKPDSPPVHDKNTKAASRKTNIAESTPSAAPQASESGVKNTTVKDRRPAVGAGSGLKRLMDFEAHIPDAPKVRTPVDRKPVKPSMFENGDDDEEDESSSESSDGE